MMFTKRHANSRNAALLPSPESCPAMRVATSEIRPKRPGVVAGADFRPAQVEDVELAFAASALGFDVHPFQEIGIPLGVDDDDDLMLAGSIPAADVP